MFFKKHNSKIEDIAEDIQRLVDDEAHRVARQMGEWNLEERKRAEKSRDEWKEMYETLQKSHQSLGLRYGKLLKEIEELRSGGV